MIKYLVRSLVCGVGMVEGGSSVGKSLGDGSRTPLGGDGSFWNAYTSTWLPIPIVSSTRVEGVDAYKSSASVPSYVGRISAPKLYRSSYGSAQQEVAPRYLTMVNMGILIGVGL